MKDKYIKRDLPQLFIVTGASCIGKSTTCRILSEREIEYVVLESDIFWHDVYNTPEDGYKAYRERWMRLCAEVSKIGKPVVLCGCAVPEQFEHCRERELFSEIHYIAVVCNQEQLEERMRSGRGVSDENWIKGSIQFNQWLMEHAGQTEPKIELLDTSDLTPEQSAVKADQWILSQIDKWNKNQNKGLI